jgi:hypothetical protein
MFRISSVVLVVGLAASAWAEGDDKTKPPAPAPAPDTTKQEPAPAPKQEPKQEPAPAAEAPAAQPAADVEPIRGTRYQITLRTGTTLTGVVTCEKVFERRDGLNWVAADKEAPGAGVRLYFVKDADGFVFILKKDMKDAEKLEDISEREGRDLAKRRVAAQHRADEERDQLRKERERREAKAKEKAEAEEKAGDETSKEHAAAMTPEEQLAHYQALLKKYPPGKWTLDSPKDIERRRIVMDLFPNEEEKAFLAVYDDWAKAFAVWKAAKDAAKATDDGAKPAEGATKPAEDGAKK